MDTWGPVLIAALSSSLLTALIQMFSDQWRLKGAHKLDMQVRTEEAKFADERRRLQAHLDAQATFLPGAEDAARWADNVATDVLGGEVSYFDPEGTPSQPLDRLPDILRDLRRIGAAHPTSAVRAIADELDSGLRGFYGDMDRQSWGDEFPSVHDRDRLLVFGDMAKKLVEAMHEPAELSALDPA